MTEKTNNPNLTDLNRAVDEFQQYPEQISKNEPIGKISKADLLPHVNIQADEEIFVEPIVERINRLALVKNIPLTELLGLLVAKARGFQQLAEKLPMPSQETI